MYFSGVAKFYILIWASCFLTTHNQFALMSESNLRNRKSANPVEFVSMENEHTLSKYRSFLNPDNFAIVLLLLLYTLQGIPMGLSASTVLILKEKNVSYYNLSLFALVTMPFSLKILWAPIVDSCFFKSIGRRKTWLLPIQIITGIVMIAGSYHIDKWIDNLDSLDILSLEFYFLFLYFLMATQDVAVDGWALTMLSKEHVGYASTCNSVGQVIGSFIANQGYIALSDPKWCYKYLGATTQLVTLSGFIYYWGWLFIILTVIILVLKSEVESHEEFHGLVDTYKQIYSVMKLESVQTLCFILLTSNIGFGAADVVFTFKLQEYGLTKTDIASLSPFIMIASFSIPAFAGPLIVKHSLKVYYYALFAKLGTSTMLWFMANMIHSRHEATGTVSNTTFGILTVVFVVHNSFSTLMSLSAMSFFAKVSDPLIGGTYMTLLNTVNNLGFKWIQFVILRLLPKLTLGSCTSKSGNVLVPWTFDYCTTDQHSKDCEALGGHCKIVVDGYTTETILCFCLGLLWLYFNTKRLLDLQNRPASDWSVSSDKPILMKVS